MQGTKANLDVVAVFLFHSLSSKFGWHLHNLGANSSEALWCRLVRHFQQWSEVFNCFFSFPWLWYKKKCIWTIWKFGLQTFVTKLYGEQLHYLCVIYSTFWTCRKCSSTKVTTDLWCKTWSIFIWHKAFSLPTEATSVRQDLFPITNS